MIGLLTLVMMAGLAQGPAGGEKRCPTLEEVCPAGKGGGGGWLLVYRWTVNVQEDFEGAPIYVTRENFDWQRFETEEAAYCGARRIRREGIRLPTLERFGRDSNVIPESITPMPHLLAVQLGIKDARAH